MKILIDIPKHIYEHAKEQSEDSNDEWDAMRAIANGTSLPEHHGRIIDESKIKTIYYHIETSKNERFHLEHVVIDGTDAPIIIEGSDCK